MKRIALITLIILLGGAVILWMIAPLLILFPIVYGYVFFQARKIKPMARYTHPK